MLEAGGASEEESPDSNTGKGGGAIGGEAAVHELLHIRCDSAGPF